MTLCNVGTLALPRPVVKHSHRKADYCKCHRLAVEAVMKKQQKPRRSQRQKDLIISSGLVS